MRVTIRKWFWVWDFDKEEQWLTDMSEKGFHLVGVGWCKYIFDEGIPGEYAVRLELLNNLPGHPESIQYIRFIEETGAEHVGSFFRWVYFRKKSQLGSFDLFSDIESRIKHLNRILFFIAPITFVNVVNSLNNFIQFFFGAGLSISMTAGVLCGMMALMLVYGFISIYLKKMRLMKERALHE